jgi:hypothetical protein
MRRQPVIREEPRAVEIRCSLRDLRNHLRNMRKSTTMADALIPPLRHDCSG